MASEIENPNPFFLALMDLEFLVPVRLTASKPLVDCAAYSLAVWEAWRLDARVPAQGMVSPDDHARLGEGGSPFKPGRVPGCLALQREVPKPR